MKTTKTLAAFALSLAAAASHAAVFSDSYEASAAGLNVAPAGWTVTSGTVDVVGTGTPWALCAGSGRCIDLDGSTGDAGILSQSLSLVGGTSYTVSFDMAGNRRGVGTESVLVSFGSANTTLTFADNSLGAAWTSFSLNFTPTTSGSYTLSFSNLGASDNRGALLDNVAVNVSAIPEPASFALMAAGLMAIGSLSRRRASR